ncbi:MAG TPA: AraC family transcriptional regulator [Sphingobacteriaceae bacterium]
MKPHLQKIPLHASQSFSVVHEISPRMYNQWHYHAEIELVCILSGSGTIFIGDGLRTFSEGDIFLIGSNLPHLTRSDIQYYDADLDLISEAIVIHFKPAVFGPGFLDLPENEPIRSLLNASSHGLAVTGEARKRLQGMIAGIRYSRGCSRVIALLQILELLSDAAGLDVISRHAFRTAFNGSDEHRLNRIYQYTLNNFVREITLKEIADIIHMTPHSFCRYFKSRTNKRYSAFLLEIRISHACKLLIETEESIALICYESGFTNCSNFNRHFRKLTGHTPLEYRRHFRKSVPHKGMGEVNHARLLRSLADTGISR